MIKTTSLETSKLLKENGFRQCSSLLWRWDREENEFILNDSNTGCEDTYAAPTTDELLEELPDELIVMNGEEGYFYFSLSKFMTNKVNHYHVKYMGVDSEKPYIGKNGKSFFVHESLPEALAQMWLYLKKEGLNGRS